MESEKAIQISVKDGGIGKRVDRSFIGKRIGDLNKYLRPQELHRAKDLSMSSALVHTGSN